MTAAKPSQQHTKLHLKAAAPSSGRPLHCQSKHPRLELRISDHNAIQLLRYVHQTTSLILIQASF